MKASSPLAPDKRSERNAGPADTVCGAGTPIVSSLAADIPKPAVPAARTAPMTPNPISLQARIGRLCLLFYPNGGRAPFQTVRAIFPHTAYGSSFMSWHYAASGYRIVPRSR
jgi:hypothetical protein